MATLDHRGQPEPQIAWRSWNCAGREVKCKYTLKSFFYSWSIVALQCVLVSTEQQDESVIHIHMFHLFWISFSFRSPQVIKWSSLGNIIAIVQLLSQVQFFVTLKDCSTSGFLVLHYILELAQTHVHWVSDAIQWSHSLSPSPSSALNLSQHQGLFQWVSSLPQVSKVLECQLQHQSFQWIFRIDFL